jgi:hypothetical protein
VLRTAWCAPERLDATLALSCPGRGRVLLIAVLAIVLIVVVAIVISAPLRTASRDGDHERLKHGELDAAREAKYREIRDAELDYRTGKLSAEDYKATDGALRAEALEILDRLEESEESEPASDEGEDGAPPAAPASPGRQPGGRG